MLHLQLLVHVRDAIIAGSTGRMAMLLLIYGGPLIGLPRIDVVSALGSLAAPNKQDAVTLGGAIHFTMGILFAIIYASLWSLGIGDRKSTRLNSSHTVISYAVFCLKKKKRITTDNVHSDRVIKRGTTDVRFQRGTLR